MKRRNARHHYMMKDYHGRKYVRKPVAREHNIKQNVMEPDADLQTTIECSSSESDFGGFDDVDKSLDVKLAFMKQLFSAKNQENLLHTDTTNISAPEEIMEVSSTKAENYLVDQLLQAKDNFRSTNRLSKHSTDDSDDYCTSLEFGLSDHSNNNSNNDDAFGQFNKPLQFNISMQISDVLYMILNFYIKYKLTQEAVVQLLKMVNLITGVKNCPESFEAFAAVFPDPYDSYRIYFCVECQCEYGSTTPTKQAVCSISGCNSTKFDYFKVLPIEKQVKETVLKYRAEIQEYEKFIESDSISDISNGNMFTKLKEMDDGKFITLSVNTDGAAAYRWTLNKPCYPIFVVINNLPPRLRFNKHNIILAAIWLSKGDPNMCLFFKHFCKEMKNLKNRVVINEERYKVVVLQTCLDTVARCKVQGTTQFNGRYGCSLCLHSGKIVNGNQIRYPIMHAKPRDHNATRCLMKEVHETHVPKLGIKNLSVFLAVPDFDIIYGFPPDYMHNVLLGVVKLMWELFTATSNHSKPFYVGLQLKEVERRMCGIRPPSTFSRYPGKLDDMKKNKAADWENMLFHYFYPCFFKILPKPYLDHFMLLSSSIFQLLDLHLSSKQIDACEQTITMFISKFQEFYGEEYMVFNVHLLSHLPASCRNFGALWNFSLFPYENTNGVVLQYRTGTKHPVIQICTKYVLNRICQHKVASNSEIKLWHSKIWMRKKKIDLPYDQRLLYILPKDVCIDVDVQEREFSYHDRIFIGNMQFRTNSSCKKLGYDDSYVYINREFFRIEQILTAKNNVTFIVAMKLNTTKLFNNMFSYSVTNTLVLKKIYNNFRQCVNVSIVMDESEMNFISICKYSSQVD